jgi:hypothetical protein
VLEARLRSPYKLSRVLVGEGVVVCTMGMEYTEGTVAEKEKEQRMRVDIFVYAWSPSNT